MPPLLGALVSVQWLDFRLCWIASLGACEILQGKLQVRVFLYLSSFFFSSKRRGKKKRPGKSDALDQNGTLSDLCWFFFFWGRGEGRKDQSVWARFKRKDKDQKKKKLVGFTRMGEFDVKQTCECQNQNS